MRRTTTTRLDTVRKRLAKSKTGTGITLRQSDACKFWGSGNFSADWKAKRQGCNSPRLQKKCRLQILCIWHGNSYFTCRWLGMCNIRIDTRKIINKNKLSRLFSRSKHANFRFKCFLGAFFSSQTVYYTRNEDKAKRNKNFDVIYILNLTVSRGTCVTSTS